MQAEIFEGELDGVPVYFINGDAIQASGTVYSPNSKLDAEKYAFFSLAALDMPSQLGWTPDIIHCNDWHTALASYGNLVKRWEDKKNRIASIVTIHNLPFLGPDIQSLLEEYGLPSANTDLPDWARVLPMPLGLWASDAIVAVSPRYADEILKEEFGCGLQEFFINRKDMLSGILNGLDTASFDPQTDSVLSANFTAETLSLRPRNKIALQQRVALPENADMPVLGMVTRMDNQKGVDIALKGLRMLKKQKWQFILLGAGDPKLETMAKQLQEEMPDRVRVETRYDAKLARQIYGGTDIFLMPSRYEPCGTSQMIAMRYGCVPIVRAVGGLYDTVTDGKTGFAFADTKLKSFNDALRRAMKLFGDRLQWEQVQKAGMALDFSWKGSAEKYLDLYKKLVSASRATAVREPATKPKETRTRGVREPKVESSNGGAV